MGLKEDKENVIREPLPAVEDVEAGLKKPQSQVLDGGDLMKPVVVAPPTIKELEAEEPLLQENPHRFVLFPIKYHEVRGLLCIPRLPTSVDLCLGFLSVMDWQLIAL